MKSTSYCISGQSILTKTNYFGKRVSILFDDGNWYTGVVTGKDTTGCWVTKFKDGTEDTSMDPGKDKDYNSLPLHFEGFKLSLGYT